MTTRRIFIDLDDTLVDFKGFADYHGLSKAAIQRMPNAYYAMGAQPGALAAVFELLERGEEVWLTGTPHARLEKTAWVQRHLPELNQRLALTHDKARLGESMDLLIETAATSGGGSPFRGKVLWFDPAQGWPAVLASLRLLDTPSPVTQALNNISLQLACRRDPEWAAREILRLRALVDPRVLASRDAG